MSFLKQSVLTYCDCDNDTLRSLFRRFDPCLVVFFLRVLIGTPQCVLTVHTFSFYHFGEISDSEERQY